MAEADKPSIIGVPIEGWRHAFAALSGMPGLIGAGMVVLFIINLATLPLLPDVRADPPVPPTIGMQIGSFLLGIVSGFLLTPVAIAVHRFVLLGELTPRYWPDPRDPRFMRFFLFTVVYQFLIGVPATLMSITAAGGTGPAIVLALVFFAILVVAIIASLRLLILFPAIA
ncbi:MAG TPA: hypothetical protein VJQ55_15650, partial [Candidatus Binatia bacterium]|nr:hypothetical protein [Candidatus Binatia bacterium]